MKAAETVTRASERVQAVCAGSLLRFALATLAFCAVGPAKAEAPPKVAIVVVGDPDRRILEAASRLEVWLDADEHTTEVSDPSLRQALLGQTQEGDGLDSLRGRRRSLGLDEPTDLHTLQAVGAAAGSDLLLTLRLRGGAIECEAFDVRAGAFFEGRIAVAESADDELERFVVPRANAAARRTERQLSRPSERVVSQNDEAPAQVDPPLETAASPEKKAARPESTDDPVMRFLRRHWPYFVAGALAATAGTILVVTGLSPDPAPPQLLFRPGG